MSDLDAMPQIKETAMDSELVKRLQAMFPEAEGYTIAGNSYTTINYSTVKEIVAALTAQVEKEIGDE